MRFLYIAFIGKKYYNADIEKGGYIMKKINVTVWNEFVHEKDEKIAEIYPSGIHGAIAEGLSCDDFNVRTATLEMPEHGLTDDVLNNTDVLIWWGHMKHADVSEGVAEKVKERVLDGMGLIVLHSGHASKPFKKLLGTSCRVKWRENDEKERLWIVDASHPIADGLPEYLEIPEEETYGEPFGIPTPDELVFVSWFEGGEIFRSGCCYKRGLGKIFYFRPGHESYPIYYREDVIKVLKNAVNWAKPSNGPRPVLGHRMPLEDVKKHK